MSEQRMSLEQAMMRAAAGISRFSATLAAEAAGHKLVSRTGDVMHCECGEVSQGLAGHIRHADAAIGAPQPPATPPAPMGAEQ